MTSLTLHLEDHILERMKASAQGVGLDKMVEKIITNYFALSKQKSDIMTNYKHESLCGIFSHDTSLDSIREEYLESKYGL